MNGKQAKTVRRAARQVSNSVDEFKAVYSMMKKDVKSMTVLDKQKVKKSEATDK